MVPRCSHSSNDDRNRDSWFADWTRTVRTLSLGAVVAFMPPPATVLAANVALTDQVANFTLPSVEQSAGGNDSLGARVIRVVKTVAPPIAAIAVTTFVLMKLWKGAEKRRLRDFKSQLQLLDTMVSLDQNALGKKSDKKNDARAVNEPKYRFRETPKADKNDKEAAATVNLDLFRAAGAKPNNTKTTDSAVSDVKPNNAFEQEVAACLAEAASVIETRGTVENDSSVEAAVKRLATAGLAAGLKEKQITSGFTDYASRVVSMHVDRAARHLDSDDAEALKNLHTLARTMGGASLVAQAQGRNTSGLQYIGRHTEDTALRDELYRRYSVFCLSQGTAGTAGLEQLQEMQSLLAVSDTRAETINKEIAKGMFQVAVSAAMADGALDERGRDALEKLKGSFEGFLDGGDADAIMSEVAVMRAMYALQQLLSDSGVEEEDVLKLRRMCADLGVDIDEMMSNADALGNALGPEAKQFVESLTDILREVDEGASAAESTVLTTTATPVTSDSTVGDGKEVAQKKLVEEPKGPTKVDDK